VKSNLLVTSENLDRSNYTASIERQEQGKNLMDDDSQIGRRSNWRCQRKCITANVIQSRNPRNSCKIIKNRAKRQARFYGWTP